MRHRIVPYIAGLMFFTLLADDASAQKHVFPSPEFRAKICQICEKWCKENGPLGGGSMPKPAVTWTGASLHQHVKDHMNANKTENIPGSGNQGPVSGIAGQGMDNWMRLCFYRGLDNLKASDAWFNIDWKKQWTRPGQTLTEKNYAKTAEAASWALTWWATHYQDFPTNNPGVEQYQDPGHRVLIGAAWKGNMQRIFKHPHPVGEEAAGDPDDCTDCIDELISCVLYCRPSPCNPCP